MKLIIVERIDDMGLVINELLVEYKKSNPFFEINYNETNPKMEIKECLINEVYSKNGSIYIDELNLDGSIGNISCFDDRYQKMIKSKMIILVASGPKYQDMIKRLFEEEKNETVSSNLFEHENFILIIDKMAAKKLPKK